MQRQSVHQRRRMMNVLLYGEAESRRMAAVEWISFGSTSQHAPACSWRERPDEPSAVPTRITMRPTDTVISIQSLYRWQFAIIIDQPSSRQLPPLNISDGLQHASASLSCCYRSSYCTRVKQWLKWGGLGGLSPPAPIWAPPAIVWAPLIESIKCYFMPK